MMPIFIVRIKFDYCKCVYKFCDDSLILISFSDQTIDHTDGLIFICFLAEAIVQADKLETVAWQH